jgi:hypothetical protein
MQIKSGDIVTLKSNGSASNTYLVDSFEMWSDSVLLTHPLAKGLLLRVKSEDVNKVSANIKDSMERSLDFANSSREFLDFNTNQDLDALCMYFFVKRKLTPRQKYTLANICGILATVKFNSDLHETMLFIKANVSLLDEFNLMWYNNFKGLFSGRQPITSKKQRSAIFNIAGYLMAELKTPFSSR